MKFAESNAGIKIKIEYKFNTQLQYGNYIQILFSI